MATASNKAELNVIIHAKKGKITVLVKDQCIGMIISDIGPGITDIALAMTEGYSIASPYLKELVYRSGIDLPNIKKCELEGDPIPGQSGDDFALSSQSE